MLVTSKEILTQARAGHYAVPAFDCVEDIMMRAVLETAESLRAPVLIMCLEPDLRGNGWYYMPGLVRAVADRHDIPIALHLDHAAKLEEVERAVELGFTSVMIDGSKLPFEKNVELTKAAVEVAHRRGISVEGELGHVGGMDLDETASADSVLTEADEVARFVDQTGVDALAVSIGTAHGVYRSLPNLNIERLKELNAASPVPLVLHGGSGTPDGQIRDAVEHGICKLNIYADCRIAMFRGLKQSAEMHEREDPLPRALFDPIYDGIAEVVREKTRLLKADGKVAALH